MKERNLEMAEIIKHKDDTIYYIRHALRELPPGKKHGNTEIDPELEDRNYPLLSRGSSNETNQYRKQLFDKEIFRYNRKGLIQSLEYVIQCPDDVIEEEKFFQTSYEYVRDQVLPMGEQCILSAVVHKDEHQYITDSEGEKIDISKPHLHIIAVPAVINKKDNGFDWKLSAHDLTSKAKFNQFHPGLQKACDDAGVKATVYQKGKKDGKKIALSVKQLKEITKKTGIVIEKSMTIDKLSEILVEHRDVKILDQKLKDSLKEKDLEILEIKTENKTLKQELLLAKEKIRELEKDISHVHEHEWESQDSWNSKEYTYEEEHTW